MVLAAEQRLVEGVQRGRSSMLEMRWYMALERWVPVVQAAQNDAGEVNGLHGDVEQGPLMPTTFHLEAERKRPQRGPFGPGPSMRFMLT